MVLEKHTILLIYSLYVCSLYYDIPWFLLYCLSFFHIFTTWLSASMSTPAYWNGQSNDSNLEKEWWQFSGENNWYIFSSEKMKKKVWF